MAMEAGAGLRQAVIIAGGKATRMRPYTDDRPKALIEIGNRSILDHQLRWLASGGIDHVVISCRYMADVLRRYVAEHSLPTAVTLVEENEPLGRGGGLKYAAQGLPYRDERWLGLNGDILTDLPLIEMHSAHESAKATATIAVARFKSPYGIVDIADDGYVSQFVESPVLPHWINAGIYLFEPDIVDLLPDKGDHEVFTFPHLADEKRLFAFQIEGYWRGIDTAKDIQEAEVDVRKLGWAEEAGNQAS